MLLSLFSGAIVVTAAGAYETVELNGFNTWTQAELDKSSGNNGYANGCITKLTVVTDAAYIVGNGSQAIKAVKGGSQSYNNCIVNWTYGTGGPCTAGNVWAPATGTVDYSAYEGIRVAVLNVNGVTANFTKITFRVTNAANRNVADLSNATVTIGGEAYKLVEFGALASNDAAVGVDEDAFDLDHLSGKTIKVAAKYLMDLEEDNASYAVRVINIPEDEANTTVYARPYFIYEDAEGEQIVVYDDIYSSTYNG